MQDWSYCCEPSSTRGHVAQADDPRRHGLRDPGALRTVLSVSGWPGLADRLRGRQRGLHPWLGRAGLEDDVAELLGLGEPAQRVDRQLELLAAGDGLLADLAGGDLQVLLVDGVDHVLGRSRLSAASLSGSSQARRL